MMTAHHGTLSSWARLVFLALSLLIAYLIGAVPFGYLVARMRGVDILKVGSGNIGATNVGRVLGRRFGILVFLLDFAKGAGPVLFLGGQAGDPGPWADLQTVGVGLAAFLGHLFPIYLGFRGGKGVATGAGAVAVLLPGPMLVAVCIWVAFFCATRTVSLASLAAVVALCGGRLLLVMEPFGSANVIRTAFAFLAAGMVVARHHANISRLLRGTENSFRESSAMLQLSKTIHVLSMGLWFGSAVFFSFVVGLSLFDTFEQITKEGTPRTWWLPAPVSASQDADTLKKQGSRVAGAAVGPMFPIYYMIQTVCGALALGTAFGWRQRGGVHRIRTIVLALALVGIGVGWWLERVVHDAGVERNTLMDQVVAGAASGEVQQEAKRAAQAFGQWHGVSLLENFLVVGLVTVGMVLAGCLPSELVAETKEPAPKPEA
jgi:acyl-phosphate glycerol 3-phosphate acyltransferase